MKSLALLPLLLLHEAQAWWTPGPGVSWQWQISGDLVLDLDVDMYNLDLFDITEAEVEDLRSRGVVVICSFSAGTYEEDRPDAGDFPESALGEYREDDESERWLNITHEGVWDVMLDRLELAVNKSCSGVDPMNTQVVGVEDTGFNNTASEQIAYNTWLAGQAHDRNLSVGLHNDVDWSQLSDLEPLFDWALSEDCLGEGECESYRDNFVAAGKAVLDVEFFQLNMAFCDNLTASGVDVIVKGSSLDERRCSCNDPSTDINCDDLLDLTEDEEPAESSYWVIATAVGASVAILVVAALVAAWKRRKLGVNIPAGLGNAGPMGGFGIR